MTEPVAKLGKYQILEKVGEGAMGVVYRALDPVLNRIVAVKVMSDGLAQDEGLRARFLREAQAAGSLQHPNVVTIYDFGEADGHLFIAMEFIQGADLEHLLRHNAPLTLAGKLDIVVDVLNGLYYAHRRGIVHRDIKPANIRVDEEGHARIMDFGVARLATSDMTKSGVMMGTPNYMAPEQISGGDISAAVDIFSVGALLYELLTNVKPFQGDTMHNVLFKIVTDTPPDVRELNADLPAALSGIVRRAIAKEPADRFRSASEMANALSAVRTTLGPARISKTLAQRVSARSAIDKALRDTNEQRARVARRRTVLVGVLSAAAAALIVGVVIDAREQNATSSTSAPSVTPAGARADSTPLALAPAVATQAATDTHSTPPPTPTVSAPRRSPPAEPPAAGGTRPAATVPTPSPARREPALAQREATPSRPAGDTARAAVTQPAPSQQTNTQAAAQTPVTTPPPAAPPVVVAPTETTRRLAPAEPDNPRPAITQVINSYARAIGTRDLAEERRVYPAITTQQQAAWESFFSSVRSMTASFEIASLDVDGTAAVARLTGVYAYVARNGRAERQNVELEATLQRDGDRWKLQAIR